MTVIGGKPGLFSIKFVLRINILIKMQELNKNINLHPCFSREGHLKYARMHLPVAPKCNIQCNYCVRKYDCVNESRPGVASKILSPEQAHQKYLSVRENMKNLTVTGFAGPGDALANFEEVIKTVELIKKNSPEMIFCLSTNGLMLPFYSREIIKAGFSHITVTINAVEPKIAASVYSEVYYNGKRFTGEQGAGILIEKQLEGLSYMSKKGVICKVNIVALRGINDFHIEDTVKTVKKYGAYKTNIMPLIPVKETPFAEIVPIIGKELNEIRNKCSGYLKQMYHCKQCRADAVGLLSEDKSEEFTNTIRNIS